MVLGEVLENFTSKKTENSIKKLLKLLPNTARVIRDNIEQIVLTEDVSIGDIIRVVPGEVIPIDGIIIKGETSINQSFITGESVPQDKFVGDEVYSGTLNQFGTFDMKVTKTNDDSSFQHLINLVKAEDLEKVKIVEKTDKWATWVVLGALTIAILTWLFTGELIRAVTILVVFCPCALILATPTAIMAGMGNASKNGALIKNGAILENFFKIKTMVFDKTGTLTYGHPQVSEVICFDTNISENELLILVGNIEKFSEHIIGKAIVEYCSNIIDNNKKEVKSFELFIGKGVTGIIDGEKVLVGNIELLNQNSINLTEIQKKETMQYINKGATIIYIAKNNSVKGMIILEDTIKPSIAKTILKLKELNVKSILLTGDNQKTAENVCKTLNINEFHSECIPEDKVKILDELLNTTSDLVCMIGDGINDAPALKKASIGIAMGQIGSDIAIDAADIVLVSDDINKIPYLINLSKKTMKTIYINLIISLLINFTFIVLSINGFLSPMQAAIVHNIGSVTVVINSALILKYKGGIKVYE